MARGVSHAVHSDSQQIDADLKGASRVRPFHPLGACAPLPVRACRYRHKVCGAKGGLPWPPPYSPAPQPIHEAPSAGPAVEPNTLIALLYSIGSGVAANGQRWPERHQLRGRQMALANADCSLTGLSVVLEVLLAAERTRQNGEPEQYVGDRAGCY